MAQNFDKGTVVISDSWEIAIWRFEMISAPLDANLTKAEKRRIIRERTTRAVQWPNSAEERPIGKSTLLRWLKNYRDKGFLGLMPKVRKDKGLARAVPQNIFDKIVELKCSNPKFTCNNTNSYLKKHYNLEINRSTYHRYMKQKSDTIQSFSSVCGGAKFDTQLVHEKDRSILEQWRKSKNKREWEKAVVILESNNLSAKQLSVKIERPVKIIQKWVRDYTNQGIESIEKDRKKHDRSKFDKIIIEKTNRIVEILHQNPRLFGINRSNWSCQCIANVYKKEYGENISKCTVARYLKNNSKFKIGKTRKILTSPDPNYREKVELLLKILHSLKPEEMLFFIDELGPLQVKKYGGRCYIKKGEVLSIPQTQISKGSVTLYGALSATTNQVTWNYGNTKNSSGMIDLVESLFNQFYDKSKIYLTWDAASWHSSNELVDWLDRFNAETDDIGKGPLIEFIPLPSNSQFVNVIESVFSAMKRAVIHLSNYQSEEEMKLAISLHFQERNEYFQENPKRAGKKIWEIDFFQDYNNLKSGDYRDW